MKLTAIRIALCVALFCSGALAGGKKSPKPPLEWQPGTLVNQSSERQCSVDGTIKDGDGDIGTNCRVVTAYVVSSQDMIYTFTRRTFPREQLLPLTVNGAIAFATDGKAFYLMAEDGKGHEVTLVRKAWKTAAR